VNWVNWVNWVAGCTADPAWAHRAGAGAAVGTGLRVQPGRGLRIPGHRRTPSQERCEQPARGCRLHCPIILPASELLESGSSRDGMRAVACGCRVVGWQGPALRRRSQRRSCSSNAGNRHALVLSTDAVCPSVCLCARGVAVMTARVAAAAGARRLGSRGAQGKRRTPTHPTASVKCHSKYNNCARRAIGTCHTVGSRLVRVGQGSGRRRRDRDILCHQPHTDLTTCTLTVCVCRLAGYYMPGIRIYIHVSE
jgi:hypothetical protein